MLKHHGHVSIPWTEAIDDLLSDQDRPTCLRFETRDNAEQRRFAAARRPEHHDERAVRSLKRNVG